ncbi:hypothetical protein L1049_018125 [Liquidambar formosana]|uniref:VTT domain-containing protein n=1 Tax=Liquidambar formosana TaxID=63359 RepID=A0AAP0NI16_LIQFO
MTYNTEANGGVVSETKFQMEGSNGHYVRLQDRDNVRGPRVHGEFVPPNPKNGLSLWWWGKGIALCVLLGALVFVVIKWAGPFFIDKSVIPIINWEMETFSTPVLAVIIFASMSLFPVVCLPSTPSMWVAGMTFGYGIGFLLVMAGVGVAVSLTYFIGSSLFHHKILGWLEKHPKNAAIIRLASEGNWFHQFRAITLIRISPFPYVIFNYAVVSMDVKYSPHLLGSLVGMVPDVLIALYSGILIRTLADATQDQKDLSTLQTIFNVAGFCVMLAATVTIGYYAKRKLDQLQEEEDVLLD